MFRKKSGDNAPVENHTDQKKKKIRIRPLVLGTVLTAYTVFTLLDAFVIPRDIVTLESVQAAASNTEKADASAEADDAQGNTDDAQGNVDGTQGSTDDASGQGGDSAGSGDDTKHKHKPGEKGGKGGSGKGRSGKPGRGSSDGSTSDSSGSTGSTSDGNTSSGKASGSKSGSDSTAENSATGEAADAAAVTSDSYQADGVSITLTEKRVYDTQVYIADIQLDDPSELLSGLAENSFGRNLSQKTSEQAESLGAVLAINGDYYGFRDTGYVMRNGYLYRSTARSGSGNEDLVVYSDGSMEIIDESEVTAEELEAKGAVQIYSFGPGLISDGSVMVTAGDEVDQSMRSNPRTAIGMVEPGHYIMVVSDGRTDESDGLSLAQLAEVMQEAGCTEAYNLDGGGSTTMWFNGEIVNNPTGGRGSNERAVSDIVYIGK
ncbi:MAG: phosphodiester glycosidase family protein [Eubacterium sp.]|nr:phosphodiester glycosidase family protein [Eubacterium sp.]